MATLIFGHKNPDTDSIASAIALSYFKNQIGENTEPVALGLPNRETEFVLGYFDVEAPRIIANVKTELRDLRLEYVEGKSLDSSIYEIFRMFADDNIKTVPLVNERDEILGIVTMKDIAMGQMIGNISHLDTRISHIIEALNGRIITDEDQEIAGRIAVIAYYAESVLAELGKYDIIIVGDRYNIIEEAIRQQTKLIIITGGRTIPDHLIELAEVQKVPVVSVETDTYTTAKLINQANFIKTIITNNPIIQFQESDYLTDVKEEILTSNHRNYPVVNEAGKYIGFVNKTEIINPRRKKVILVDHNEIGQSAVGIEEAEIVEIVDHHKIGDIATDLPIKFTNIPLGSTCTIVYRKFVEQGIEIPYEIAGLLISGIISDTLALNSPTATEDDKDAIIDLNNILDLDIEEYTMKMFSAGTSLAGYSEQEIFHKDFKEFMLGNNKVGVSQIFTLDTTELSERKDALAEYIKALHQDKGYYLTVLLVTDIIKNGSYIFYYTESEKLLAMAFEGKVTNGQFLEDIISRKKQVVPKIMHAYRNK